MSEGIVPRERPGSTKPASFTDVAPPGMMLSIAPNDHPTRPASRSDTIFFQGFVVKDRLSLALAACAAYSTAADQHLDLADSAVVIHSFPGASPFTMTSCFQLSVRLHLPTTFVPSAAALFASSHVLTPGSGAHST